jgi:hypothetical protein
LAALAQMAEALGVTATGFTAQDRQRAAATNAQRSSLNLP